MDSHAVFPELIKDIENRNKAGWETYRKPMMTFDGRKTLQDAYEEALDLAVYLKKALMEAGTNSCNCYVRTLGEEALNTRRAGSHAETWLTGNFVPRAAVEDCWASAQSTRPFSTVTHPDEHVEFYCRSCDEWHDKPSLTVQFSSTGTTSTVGGQWPWGNPLGHA